ncbi:RagB/SusD family nutrient uptake outer membrane protein [Mucilaginibacter corticis]|uniref:RagB/SusD family nutrient uptake outer membrane protein n=1 Tax=Mucilaginibacter corticis TaxID=2597670 RepID=A0A556MKS8_9SPHI|nr:RagB/SusD family nutrient uptake outer membrane protein [Mucilaginibacter corticis]TSJ40531.1 RagB/SusD family nutrient uptake outer membrane protein [Mucilaginibacter corticis]
MKNKILNYMIAFCIISCSLWSCKKQLDVFPTTQEVNGNVIKDTKSATEVLNGVYYRFANVNTINGPLGADWVDVNEWFPFELAGSMYTILGDDNVYSITYGPTTGGTAAMWTYSFAIVNAANGFLENVAPVNSVPAATKSEMIAEAKFLRAFGNSQLLLYYAQYANPASNYGIIIRDKFVTTSTIGQARSTVAASYKAILEDLDAAIAGLPAKNTTIYQANANVAKLLKARVLINRNEPGDYATVISLTNDIITGGAFSLDPSAKDMFYNKLYTSKEPMLGIPVYPNQPSKNYQYNTYGSYAVTDSYAKLLTNDPRSNWVYLNQSLTFYTPYFTTTGTSNELTKYYSGPYTTYPDAGNVQVETCYPFRVTEAYLLQAEAITLSNGDLTAAKTLLKAVEASAGITSDPAVDNAGTAAALHSLIVKEEIKNFIGENGADWFALRRLPLSEIQTYQPAIKSVDQLILPIPQADISSNGSIKQNPGYL